MKGSMDQVLLNKETFAHLEKNMLEEGNKLLKDLFATFKLKMLLDTHVTPELQEKTAQGLKKYREQHWDTTLPREEAYKKYLQS